MTTSSSLALSSTSTSSSPPPARVPHLVSLAYRAAVTLAAPFAWRRRGDVAVKLLRFSSTEHGSAKDMLRASWEDTDARRRRLFFVHALDEFHHADLFRHAARALSPTTPMPSDHVALAREQQLFRDKGVSGLLAFVEEAESRGLAHFQALHAQFVIEPSFAREDSTVTSTIDPKTALTGDERQRLSRLFAAVADDEKFHMQYAARLLVERAVEGDAPTHRTRTLARLRSAKDAWMRSGKSVGDHVVRLLLWAFVFTVFPFFARVSAKRRAHPATWNVPRPLLRSRSHSSSTMPPLPDALAQLRRQL